MVETDLTCPRCGDSVAAPSVWSSSWRCAKHGDVHPLRQVRSLSPEGLAGLLRNAVVPVMLPWPLPGGWLLTGFAAAGDDGFDPGAGFPDRSPHAQVEFGNHEFPLWHVDAPARAAFAGEVMGTWLWILLWPDTAGTLLVEPMRLLDLRDPGQELDLPFGARSPRLPGETG